MPISNRVHFKKYGNNVKTAFISFMNCGLYCILLTAVYSRTISRAEEFASKYGATKIFTNLKEMEFSQEIDAVYIATPNSYNTEQAILFL